MNRVNQLQSGKQTGLHLAGSVSSDWFEWTRSGEPISILVTFTAIADAVGTLQIERFPAQVIAFADENDTPQTTLAVTAARHGTSHEFVIPDAPRARYRVTYTRTSGGANDTLDISWS